MGGRPTPDATEPALTREEWARLEFFDGFTRYDAQFSHRLTMRMEDRSYVGIDARRHALAALCLHGQPFGFTHADVVSLRALAREFEDEARVSERTGADDAEGIWRKNADACRRRADELTSIAGRLAALLPPLPSTPGAP